MPEVCETMRESSGHDSRKGPPDSAARIVSSNASAAWASVSAQSTTSLTAVGTTKLTQGRNCTYSVRATADLTLTENALNGTVTYRDETNHGSDCGVLETCLSQQSVSGSRPPK